MNRENSSPASDDHGWLITPRALTSLATIVGLVYTLHAPVRYVLQVGATMDALTARVSALETEVDQQRGTIAAAELAIIAREAGPLQTSAAVVRTPNQKPAAPHSAAPHR